MLDSIIGSRSVEAILAGHCRVVLGGQEYLLPDLPNRANREWLASFSGDLGGLMSSLDANQDNVSAILAALTAASDQVLELLMSYDRTSVLPSREWVDENATPREIVYAVMGVWQAANPLVGIALSGVIPTSSTPSVPTSSSSPTTATRGRRSRKN
jgi:hypothetical protein